MHEVSFIRTPIGILEINTTVDLIVKIKFVSKSLKDSMNNSKEFSDITQQVFSQINEYFNGDRRVFTIPFKLNLTPFYKRVLKEVYKVEYGSKASYGEIARRLGSAKAVRAVGTANSKNPLPIIIPCHRIISSNGGLGGYSGGLDKKSYLLGLEGKYLAQ
ncbi:MAG: methylated-DNA--[protein]-cysteine S-methyltransferase [Candidatus Neomarinimicrobiota bacterium]|tara:strand:+ start:13061 stop:13540 length:480 start_codon:yes stop_codon:yes gene_type:complete